jgi:hypothetical protein
MPIKRARPRAGSLHLLPLERRQAAPIDSSAAAARRRLHAPPNVCALLPPPLLSSPASARVGPSSVYVNRQPRPAYVHVVSTPRAALSSAAARYTPQRRALAAAAEARTPHAPPPPAAHTFRRRAGAHSTRDRAHREREREGKRTPPVFFLSFLSF